MTEFERMIAEFGYVKFILIVYCVQLVICSYFTSFVTAQKGYSSVNWFFVGILFGIIALIAAAGLPLNPEGSKYTKRCHECGELIDAKALICRYCGRPDPRGRKGEENG